MQQERQGHFFPYYEMEDEQIDFKRIFYILLNNWYYILIFILIGGIVSFLYLQRQNQVYETTATIMVPKSGDSFSIDQLFDEKLLGTSAEVKNELEILSSYTLNYNTVQRLGWRLFVYRRNMLRWESLYQNEPFIVAEDDGFNNPSGLYIEVEPIDNQSCVLSTSGKVIFNGVEQRISFETKCFYGQPFKNKWFSFTITPKQGAELSKDSDYRFIFRDPHKLTQDIQKLLETELADKSSEVIRLKIQGSEPLRSVEYINALIESYMNDKLQMKTQMQRQTLNFINQRLAGISDSLDLAGNRFNAYRSKHGIFDLSVQGEMVMEEMRSIEEQILAKKNELQYYKGVMDFIASPDENSILKAPSIAGIQDPSLSNLVNKLSELQSRREILTISTHENNPSMERLDKEIAQVIKQLNENLSNLISNTETTLLAFEKQKSTIGNKISQLPEQEQQLINISRRYEITGNLYDLMLQKRAEFEIALASAVHNIKVIDQARLENVKPTGINRLLILLLGAVVGGTLVVAFILIKDLFDNKIHVQEDVERLTDISILGHILHNNEKSELPVYVNPLTPLSESFRSIRTNLNFSLAGQDKKVICVNSMLSGEGKTFVSANIASILAMNDKKTLLICGDMRRPRIAHLFGIENKNGLSTYLSGQDEYEQVIQKNHVPNLFLISAGKLPPNPSELLERERFSKLIEQAKKDFDYIVIDNSPVSMVTDAYITSKYSDLNIFLLRNGVSKKDQVKFINGIAHKKMMNNVSLVINDVVKSKLGYGYGYSSSSRYAYTNSYN